MVNAAAATALYASLKKGLGEFVLDVEFTLSPGVTILFGASGAGKTTVLDCLAGLTTPDEGRIVVGERTLFDDEQRIDVPVQLRHCGYLFQTLALFPHLNARHNIEYGMSACTAAEREQRVSAILESFRIAHVAERRPAEISGGERQRVALARALVTDPSYLLLDEPLSALDRPTKSLIIDDLRRWNASHSIPILYVTHDREEAFALGDRVLVVEEGKISAEGTPHEVFDRPSTEGVAQLAGFENIFDATVIAPQPDSGTMSCRIVPPVSTDPARPRLSPSGYSSSGVVLEVPLGRSEPGESVRIGIRAGDILVALERPEGISARNLLAAEILSIARREAVVVLTLASAEDRSVRFEVDVTPRSLTTLSLHPGAPVWLVIKTHSCRILKT